jgi:hypothetical protein
MDPYLSTNLSDLKNKKLKELEPAKRAELLSFVIHKTKAIRDFVSAMTRTLNEIDADGDPRKARGKLFEIANSPEYSDFRSCFERMQLLMASDPNLYFPLGKLGAIPGGLEQWVEHCLRSLEPTAPLQNKKPMDKQTVQWKVEALRQGVSNLSSNDCDEIETGVKKIAADSGVKIWDLRDETHGKLFDTMREVEKAAAQLRQKFGDSDSGLLNESGIANEVLRKSPWFSGSFYLVTFIAVIAVVSAAQNYVSAWAFPMVLIIGAVVLAIIGAIQLRNDDRLSEKKFFQLMKLAFGRLGNLVQFWKGQPSSRP